MDDDLTGDAVVLRRRLEVARGYLASALEAMKAAERKYGTAREMGGGIPGFGGAGPQRAAVKVRAAYSSAGKAWTEANERVERWSYKVKRLEARLAEIERVRFTAADLKGAVAVKDAHSWHHVVKVNAKSVTVETPYSWTERIPLDRVTEFKTA